MRAVFKRLKDVTCKRDQTILLGAGGQNWEKETKSQLEGCRWHSWAFQIDANPWHFDASLHSAAKDSESQSL